MSLITIDYQKNNTKSMILYKYFKFGVLYWLKLILKVAQQLNHSGLYSPIPLLILGIFSRSRKIFAHSRTLAKMWDALKSAQSSHRWSDWSSWIACDYIISPVFTNGVRLRHYKPFTWCIVYESDRCQLDERKKPTKQQRSVYAGKANNEGKIKVGTSVNTNWSCAFKTNY